jgi:hypothetical protein
VFDRVTLVVAPRHLEKAGVSIPSWWGVMLATAEAGPVELSTYRIGETNPCYEPETLARLFWRDEAVAFLRSTGSTANLDALARRELLPLLVQIDLNTTRAELRRVLKGRTDWRASSQSS